MTPRPVIGFFVALPPRAVTPRGGHPLGFGLVDIIDPSHAWFDDLCARLGEALAPAGIVVERLPLPDDPDFNLDLVTPAGSVRLFVVAEGPSRHAEAPPGWWSWWMDVASEAGEVELEVVLTHVVAALNEWPDAAGARVWESFAAYRSARG